MVIDCGILFIVQLNDGEQDDLQSKAIMPNFTKYVMRAQPEWKVSIVQKLARYPPYEHKMLQEVFPSR